MKRWEVLIVQMTLDCVGGAIQPGIEAADEAVAGKVICEEHLISISIKAVAFWIARKSRLAKPSY
jgi:hypothetical protein